MIITVITTTAIPTAMTPPRISWFSSSVVASTVIMSTDDVVGEACANVAPVKQW